MFNQWNIIQILNSEYPLYLDQNQIMIFIIIKSNIPKFENSYSLWTSGCWMALNKESLGQSHKKVYKQMYVSNWYMDLSTYNNFIFWWRQHVSCSNCQLHHLIFIIIKFCFISIPNSPHLLRVPYITNFTF